jgi:hypothetical protein
MQDSASIVLDKWLHSLESSRLVAKYHEERPLLRSINSGKDRHRPFRHLVKEPANTLGLNLLAP